VHSDGAYKCTRAAWNLMREQGYGRIINITSATGLFGEINVANYATAKLGLHGFTQSLALEGAKKNIFTNSIAPIADTRLLGLV
jgi:NAD(P)-dependent dehydrogenase (short-subunit alcohol dehydrogenase family)